MLVQHGGLVWNPEKMVGRLLTFREVANTADCSVWHNTGLQLGRYCSPLRASLQPASQTGFNRGARIRKEKDEEISSLKSERKTWLGIAWSGGEDNIEMNLKIIRYDEEEWTDATVQLDPTSD